MQFDTDTAALKQREEINKRAAKYDLEQWIFEHIKVTPGQRVLDLGCGRGKQIFALAPRIQPGGTILGIDVASAAVAEVKRSATAQQLGYVDAITGSFDDWRMLVSGKTFDLIISTYAIYYAKNMKDVLIGLRQHLAANGQLFICGPGDGSNREIVEQLKLVVDADTAQKLQPGADFISQELIEEVAKSYKKYQVFRLNNEIVFASVAECMNWWSNHNSYIAKYHQTFEQQLQQYFKKHQQLKIAKNVLGVLWYV